MGTGDECTEAISRRCSHLFQVRPAIKTDPHIALVRIRDLPDVNMPRPFLDAFSNLLLHHRAPYKHETGIPRFPLNFILPSSRNVTLADQAPVEPALWRNDLSSSILLAESLRNFSQAADQSLPVQNTIAT